MSIYGNNIFSVVNEYTDIEYVNEAKYFLSSEGKKLKEQIKQILNDNYEKLGLKDRIKKIMLTGKDFDEKIADKIYKELESKINHDTFHAQNVIKTVITTGNGGSTTTYTQEFIFSIKNKVYNFKLYYNINGGSMGLFAINEKDIDKSYIYPKDVVDLAIKNCKDNFIVQFSKSVIKSTDVHLHANEELYYRLKNYIEDNHPELEAEYKNNLAKSGLYIKKKNN